MYRSHHQMLVRGLPLLCAASAALVFGSTAMAVPNLLGNPSFETPDASAGDVSDGPGGPWNGFNQGFLRYTTRATAHSGLQSFKAFGPFDGIGGGVGATQTLPAAPGQQFSAEVYAMNLGADPIQGNNFGVYKIEFLNASGGLAAGGLLGVDVFESNQINASTPRDVWTLLGVGTAPAPAGTAFINVVMVGVQLGDGTGTVVGGAIFWDDASLIEVPAPSAAALLGIGGLIATRRRRA